VTTKKPTLGRGLADLLGQKQRPVPTAVPVDAGAAPAAAPATAAEPAHRSPPGDELASLPVGLLQRGKYQPRVDMRQEALEELAISIRSQGVIQPIVVRALARAGRRASRSATRSSPASAAGAPRRLPACRGSRP
jgi:ParB family transcriptional regulator, chromosome partitioning protein